MPSVELLYDADCPNVAATRAQLLKAFVEAKLAPKWSERLLDRDALGHGSPTVLVDGRDVAGSEAGPGSCCRLYPTADGQLARAPTVAQIASALERARPRVGKWRSSLSVLPGIGAALLPKVACPACWPAYAGLLSSLGLGFLMDTTWLLPLTALFLAVAVGALALRARAVMRYGPLLFGIIAAALVLVSKFVLEHDVATYGAVALLVAASLWNNLNPRRQAT